ncbi:uncharacterized protein ARMOST_02839 [Armillaria ostoyae]|uniref:Uncharacterized protein n=1 Tax=Armillaria ostoyae TaxID=47428 RepID=A0A284QSR9_ARMOS|nr:uncharacterized protein ARMOST_02839 [Armillaria ostoyae]
MAHPPLSSQRTTNIDDYRPWRRGRAKAMLDSNMERVPDNEVGVAVVFDKEVEGEEDKEGFENRDESDDDEDAGTGQVGEYAGPAKSTADKDIVDR